MSYNINGVNIKYIDYDISSNAASTTGVGATITNSILLRSFTVDVTGLYEIKFNLFHGSSGANNVSVIGIGISTLSSGCNFLSTPPNTAFIPCVFQTQPIFPYGDGVLYITQGRAYSVTLSNQANAYNQLKSHSWICQLTASTTYNIQVGGANGGTETSQIKGYQVFIQRLQ
jgi:hypothetical protein